MILNRKISLTLDEKKDNPFWTKSQNRILKDQAIREDTIDGLSKYRHLNIKPLDLSRLNKDYLPENKMKKLFSEKTIIQNLKNKYLMKNLLQPENDRDIKTRNIRFKNNYQTFDG